MRFFRFGLDATLSVQMYGVSDIMISLARNSAEPVIRRCKMNEYEIMFMEMANDPGLRQGLLERLEKIGLLSAFLQAENGTT